ncbi:MAG: FAD-binding oxidoreductase [Acidimicrobiia bacterium]|nr:FAD-binding oxidoreductase [Acidimicrobiia bacterium]
MTARGRTTLRGWGNTTPSTARVAHLTSPTGPSDQLAAAGPRGSIARGLGRSYGDAAQNAGGVVLDMVATDGSLDLDTATGALTADGGVSVDEILRRVVPQGWILPVLPGTSHVTVGGAIACDVHGKNHHRVGSIGSHLASIDLVIPSGDTVTIGPNRDAHLFWATVGGMGLTGIISSATIDLRAIRSSRLRATTVRTSGLAATMDVLEQGDQRHEHSVAWVDLQQVSALGRGVVTFGDHAPPGDSDIAPGRRPPIVPRMPVSAIRPSTVGLFNELWWRRAPDRPRTRLTGISRFFHPLDGLAGWPRLYGPNGFVQWQMVVPDSAAPLVGAIAARLAAGEAPVALAVLKRFGPGNPAPLSFPIAGWTLAVDLPAGAASTAVLLDELDELVSGVGGRIYLAKDARLRRSLVARMYPRLGELDTIRAAIDPTRRMQSDLERRLLRSD